MAAETIEQLNERYRALKAKRSALLTSGKGEKWPAEAVTAAAGASITDAAAAALEPEQAAELAKLETELVKVSHARRLLRKPWRQQAAKEAVAAVKDRVAAMSDAEKEALKKELADG